MIQLHSFLTFQDKEYVFYNIETMGFKEFQSLLPYYKSGHNETTKLDHSVGRKKGLFREIQTAKAISGGWAEGIAKSVGRTCQFQRDRLWWEGAVKLEQPGSYNGGRWARLQSKICCGQV